jgi:predicted metalloprotease
MRWQGRRQSSNVEDQRGSGGGFGGGGGGFGGFGGGGGRMTKGGIGVILVIVVISLILGKNPLSLLQGSGGSGMDDYSADQSTQVADPQEDQLADFVSVVLAETEDVWHQQLKNYREPTLVLFRGSVESGCGTASAATGPFYCSQDEKLYIDLSFYEDLKSRFEAPGDFAQAYVIAHEVGHHVQHILGITDKVHAMHGQISDEEYNKLSVKLELQADFLAGVWAHYADRTKDLLEEGDIEEALTAASAIGDDKLQMQGQGYVVPDSFTHGTSAQRVRWFKKGYESGDIDQGDTFNASSL